MTIYRYLFPTCTKLDDACAVKLKPASGMGFKQETRAGGRGSGEASKTAPATTCESGSSTREEAREHPEAARETAEPAAARPGTEEGEGGGSRELRGR